MANKDLSLEPHKINGDTWWYEEKVGIELIHQVYGEKGYLQTNSFIIPWRSIRAALKRKDK